MFDLNITGLTLGAHIYHPPDPSITVLFQVFPKRALERCCRHNSTPVRRGIDRYFLGQEIAYFIDQTAELHCTKVPGDADLDDDMFST